MNQAEIAALVSRQRQFFHSGKTLDVDFRIQALRRMYAFIQTHEAEIHEAIAADLGKSAFESYMCEVGLVLSELSHQISHCKRYARPRRAATPLAQFAARSYALPSPYGVTLIMSPWNYPFMLSIDPMVDAIAAGNTVMLKPSAYSPHTSRVLEAMLHECFPPEYAAVVTGGRAENQFLLDQKFDYIFFTGSQAVGKEVLRRAAEHLTPTTLELGGKSPCIVDETAKIPLAAKRIVFGKFLNCGQTCVAPDYILCHSSVKDELLRQLQQQIQLQFGEAPLENPDYGKIINRRHFDRISRLLSGEKIVCGGQRNPETLQIAPTVLDQVSWDAPVMQEEIFGPVLPVLTFDRMEDVVEQLRDRQIPLALYLFSENRQTIRRVTRACRYGGGCINDTIIHLATTEMGFGGMGESGMGAYHGKIGFDTFSSLKSTVDKATWMDLPMRYQPYRAIYGKLIRMFLH